MLKSRVAVCVGMLAACAGGALAAPPANNACSAATTLSPTGAFVNGTTIEATTDAPAGACATSSNDVWYKVVRANGSATQTCTITTCSTATTFDTVLRVYIGACGNFYPVTCNNDSGCGSSAGASTVSFTVSAGQTYYISVAGVDGATGTFQISGSLSAANPLGPDVMVGDLSDVMNYGSVGGISGHSIGTTSCNLGDQNVVWVANTNRHPVIGQNFYRISENRMELIGQSWLKHGFTALTQNLCATCSGQGGAVLGVGCSDPYVASLNGDQSRLGPRSHVNATTGFYPYPFTTPPAPYQVPPAAAATIGRRVQILANDLNATLHPGAIYFAECQYITADDAQFVNSTGLAINGLNNVSYRRGTAGATTIGLTSSTIRMLPALKGWQSVDPTVVVNSYDYQEGAIVCRYWVGAKTVDNGNGTWTYNYTVFNLNSDRSLASFSVPASNVESSAFYQRTPRYHSGEPASMNNEWVRTASNNAVTWATPDTFSASAPWGSALRWSTAATFSLTTNTAPTTGTCSMTFFKPGTAANLDFTNLPVPTPGVPPCAADFNDDGVVDFFDYLDFVNAYAANSPSADFNGSGTIDFFDYLDYVDAFTLGC